MHAHVRIQPDIAPLPNIAAVKVEDPKEGIYSLSLPLFSLSSLSLPLPPFLLLSHLSNIFTLQLRLVEYLRVAPYE